MFSTKNNSIKILITVFIFVLIFLQFNIKNVFAGDTDQSILEPSSDQYFELRGTTVKEVTGQNKQLIMELWGYNIDFKGFDVRFSYDETKFSPSNIETNVATTDETEYFKFEDEFSNSLELFDVGYTGDGEGFRWVTSFNPPVTESEHIIEKDGIGKIVTTQGGVLLGKMSFQMTADEFDVSGFKLVEDTTSPTTGIKINLDGTNSYQAQSTFIFTDKTASKDAYLSNIIVSSGQVDTENPDNSTYKEYTLTPTFDKDTLNYEIELLEYIDTIDIKATQNDSKATMKIKVPKRDADNNLVYDTDGVTIIYEEKDLLNDIPMEVTINKLGEPDTNITVIVTAEDGKTINNYELVIKRPYGTIKGRNILADFDDQDIVDNVLDVYGIQLENIADINIYKSDLAEWESISDIYGVIYPDPFTYEKLEDIDKEISYKTEDDGTFEIYVIPGTYDVQVTRLGFLDYIYSDVDIKAGDVIDMGEIRLTAGDANRDGVISQEDVNTIKKYMDMDSSDPNFKEQYNPSQIGAVVAEDLGYAKGNQDQEIQIVYFS